MDGTAEWGKAAGVKREIRAPELAALVGCQPKQAWEWLSGRRYPYGPNLLRLSRALGRPADAILRACELARERRLARLAAEKARKDAESS